MSSGQPSVENGQSPEENQVSSTSSSCCTAPPHPGHRSISVRETWVAAQVGQYHTGIRCPHQSWREIGQSRMFSIQW